jgi:hypothetical protein
MNEMIERVARALAHVPESFESRRELEQWIKQQRI